MNSDVEWQVTSLKLSKRLKDLGVPQDSLWYWIRSNFLRDKHLDHYLKSYEDGLVRTLLRDQPERVCSAFTVAELLRDLPEYVEHPNQPLVLVRDTDTHGLLCGYDEDLVRLAASSAKDADALAKLRIHLIEKGIIDLKGKV